MLAPPSQVMVFESGKLVEMGPPHVLLGQESGVFKALYDETSKATEGEGEEAAAES